MNDYELVLIPNYRGSSPVCLAQKLVAHGKSFEPPFDMEVFDFHERYQIFLSAPKFTEEERVIPFFIGHYNKVIFRPGVIPVVCNFDPRDLPTILGGIRTIQPVVKIILLVAVEVSLLDINDQNLEMFYCPGPVPKLELLYALFPSLCAAND